MIQSNRSAGKRVAVCIAAQSSWAIFWRHVNICAMPLYGAVRWRAPSRGNGPTISAMARYTPLCISAHTEKGAVKMNGKEVVYINPWRHRKSGGPAVQKSPPRLKSAFADRRKKRIHSRGEFRAYDMLATVGNVHLDYTRGKIFANFGVYAPSVGIGLGACSRVQANAILANCVVNEIFGGRVNGGAVWFDTIKQMP